MLRIQQFEGVELNAAKTKLPTGKFQKDAGGRRFAEGAWSQRRGMVHTGVAKYSGAVVSILGFEMAGVDFAVVFGEGTNLQGETNVAEQA